MRILITGNMGYVGPVLIAHLRNKYPASYLAGCDAGFFANALSSNALLPETNLDVQFFKDVRDIQEDFLENYDSIIHLSAISNDPMGKEFERVTYEINLEASTHLVSMAARTGVKNFVFASSCSMYGTADSGARKEDDPTNPLTAYAKSKIQVENRVKQEVDLREMTFTSLRFATACGISPRLRLDLVLNDFVACAVTSGSINVLSDGSPWRPLIDVKDMARAIDWAAHRNVKNGGQFLAVNAGGNHNNYQVKDLAYAVCDLIPGTEVHINKNAQPDLRSYKVDFSLFEKLAPSFIPTTKLSESIIQLKDGLRVINFSDSNFRNSNYIRLNSLRNLINSNQLNNELRVSAKG